VHSQPPRTFVVQCEYLYTWGSGGPETIHVLLETCSQIQFWWSLGTCGLAFLCWFPAYIRAELKPESVYLTPIPRFAFSCLEANRTGRPMRFESSSLRSLWVQFELKIESMPTIALHLIGVQCISRTQFVFDWSSWRLFWIYIYIYISIDKNKTISLGFYKTTSTDRKRWY
jgi:hypothetical protein